MVQAKLNNSTFKQGFMVTRKMYTKEDVEKKCKIWHKSNQLGFDGCPFFTYKNLEEVEWVKSAILDALNNPGTFQASDTYGALCNLKKLIKGKNAEKLKAKYGIPLKLEYRNSQGVNSIVDANHDDKVIIPVTASELLDLIADLNKNRKPSDIFEFYDWYHKEVTIESLELFHNYYKQCKLNKLIKYICSKSNEIGGFQDYGVGIIRNRLTSQYLYDSRKRSVKQ